MKRRALFFQTACCPYFRAIIYKLFFRAGSYMFLFFLIIQASCTPKNISNNNISKNYEESKSSSSYEISQETAVPEKETKVTLSDGGSIVLPAFALSGPAQVIAEKNPIKIKDLPPLPEWTKPLGDFYNFSIQGNSLIGNVELLLPYDDSKIPNDPGFLAIAIPDSTGWKYIPVEGDGKLATYETQETGDPIIVWHFACTPQVQTAECGENEWRAYYQEHAVCDPDIPLQVLGTEGESSKSIRIVGRLVPQQSKYLGIIPRKQAANIPVKITINQQPSEESFTTITDAEGNFFVDIERSPSEKLMKNGWNWVFAQATCEKWFGDLAVKSKGYLEFKLSPITDVGVTPSALVDNSDSLDIISLSQANTSSTNVENSLVRIPNLIGRSFDQAKEQLKNLGFGLTWIDGQSVQEVGSVYKQSPASGEMYNPKRTTVVLWRTTTQIEPTPTIAPTPEKYTFQYGCIENTVAYISETPAPAAQRGTLYVDHFDNNCWQNSDPYQVTADQLNNGLSLDDWINSLSNKADTSDVSIKMINVKHYPGTANVAGQDVSVEIIDITYETHLKGDGSITGLARHEKHYIHIPTGLKVLFENEEVALTCGKYYGCDVAGQLIIQSKSGIISTDYSFTH